MRSGLNQDRNPGIILKLFYPDIAVLHLHGWAHMNLYTDESGVLSIHRVVVRHITDQHAVDKMLEPVTLGDDMTAVPVITLHQRSQRILTSK